jgi:hypothetical protein
VFFFHWYAHRNSRRFFLSASLAILVGWSFPLLSMPGIFLRNVLGYSSNWGGWGITYWLSQTRAAAFAPIGFSGLSPEQVAIMSALKLVIVATALSLAWRRWGLGPEHVASTLALVWAAFFVFAPGVGAQYLVWFAPFLAIHSARWFAAITTASSVFLFVFYTTISGGLPWGHGVSTAELVPQWARWSNLPWLALVAFLAVALRNRGSSRMPAAAEPGRPALSAGNGSTPG